jgi:hypothetical protein
MTNNQIEKIERVRAKIIENQQINDNLYQELIYEFKLKQYSLEEEFLFDAVFNSPKQDDFNYFLQECQKRLNSL